MVFMQKLLRNIPIYFVHIFNRNGHISLMEGKIPQQWKEANVRAFYKKEANISVPITGQSALPPL